MSAPARIPRPILAARLQQAVRRGAVMLVAGAGYGKTLAVEEALRGVPSAWISARTRAEDADALLLGGLRAVQRAVPGVADVLIERVTDGASLPPAAVIRALLRELDVLLVEPLVLVVDDAERLSEAGLAFVGELLATVAERLRVVICSRRALELPLARLEASGRLTTFGERDLAFDAAECAALLEVRNAREPAEAEVEVALRSTLGWPLGLALGGAAGTGGDGLLARFVAEEVLQPLDARTRATVLASSAVEVVTPSIAAALDLPGDLADRLGGVGVLLHPIPDRRDTLAYHPLLRDLLREEWYARTPAVERERILAAAATALLADGRLMEAVDAWLEAGQAEPALAALIREAGTLVRLSPGTAQRWLERLPDSARDDPRAVALAGRLAASHARHLEAARLLRSAVAGLSEPAENATVRAALLESLYWTGQLEEGLRVAADAPVSTPLIRFWDAYLRAAVGRIDEAEALLPKAAHPTTVGRLDVGFYLVAGPDGRHEEAIARLQARYHALPREERVGHWPQHVASFTAFAMADAGRPEEGLRWVEAAHDEMVRAGLGESVGPLIHIHRGWQLALAGREAEAEVALGALPGSGPPQGWTPVVLLATRAMCALARGDLAQARTLAEQALPLEAIAPVQFRLMVAWALAPVLAEASGPAAAHALLDRVLAMLDAQLPSGRGDHARRRVGAVRAWVHWRDGDLPRAADALAPLLAAEPDASRELVIRAERRLLEPTLAALLAADLVDPDAALHILSRGRNGGEALATASGDGRAPVRVAAARVAGRSGHARAAALLQDLAGDDDPEVAATARAALAVGLAPPPPRHFEVFGGFAFKRGDWTAADTDWRRPTSARLVRVLLTRRGVLIPQDELIEALWPESIPKAARTSLQVAASRARAVLDPAGAAHSAIQHTEGAYRLVLDPLDRVDTEVFALAARAALDEHGPDRTRLLERAAALWDGEPLPEDRYADWAREWREGLEALHGRVMRALAEALARAGDHGGAASAAAFVLEHDPLDEGMHRLLIASHARAGQRSRALRQYLACRRALVDALGIEPAEETQTLQRRILAGARV